jgi:hypothetical protein
MNKHPVTCAPWPCKRLSRSPWQVVTSGRVGCTARSRIPCGCGPFPCSLPPNPACPLSRHRALQRFMPRTRLPRARRTLNTTSVSCIAHPSWSLTVHRLCPFTLWSGSPGLQIGRTLPHVGWAAQRGPVSPVWMRAFSVQPPSEPGVPAFQAPGSPAIYAACATAACAENAQYHFGFLHCASLMVLDRSSPVPLHPVVRFSRSPDWADVTPPITTGTPSP